jgi:type I restriction-modification system DNA methylase subunit
MAKTSKAEQEEPLEKKLWKAADKLRKNMDAAEYKHIVLGMIFLKYISDAFEELYEKLVAQKSEGADPEDKNEYVAEKVFYVPPSARWKWIQGRATLPTIGKDVDEAMDAIERDNPKSLRGVLPKVFAQEKLDKASLGGLINLIGSATLGTKEAQSKDLLGKVFEYFLGEFALAEGKKGGQFYTPSSVVRLLVEMLEPYEGRVFDPCCGSGGMFVQSEKFIESHQDHYKQNSSSLKPADHISLYGQESNQTTWRLAKMNLAIRGIDSTNVKWNNEGSFLNDAHKDLKADFVIANPPFNDSDWSGELLRDDARWKVLGKTLAPPAANANYAWIQHFVFHLAPNGLAGFVLAKGSLTSTTSNEGEIRKALSGFLSGKSVTLIYDAKWRLLSSHWGKSNPENATFNLKTTAIFATSEFFVAVYQSKTVPIENLRENVQKRLQYKNPRQKLSCGEAVQLLLDTAAEMFPKWKGQNSRSFMEAFDRIASQRGFVAGMPADVQHYGGTVEGDAFAWQDGQGVNAIAYLHPFAYDRMRPGTNEQAQLSYSFKAIHETFHLAARGGYSDKDMAEVVSKITGWALPPKGSSVEKYSQFWDTYLNAHCRIKYWRDIK